MPVYEYFCRTCNTKHEKLRAMKDADAPVDCPECGQSNSVRALSLVAFSMGGSTRAIANDSVAAASQSSGGCCGGACGCGHNHN